jgi:ATP-dependent Lon protease
LTHIETTATPNFLTETSTTTTPTVFKHEHPQKVAREYQINSKNLEKFLDMPSTDDNYYSNINKQLPMGSSNGLAYVDEGYGTVLKIQFVIKEYGKKAKQDDDKSASVGDLTHTGRLGEVMKESVEVVKIAVFNFLTQNNHLAKFFDKDSYHLHVPMGAIPKDGPSAGISLFAAMVSIATHKPVVENIAMTGEITTLGEVISIGGVREKLTACKNHSISRVILPKSNKKHVDKLPIEFKKGFTIFYVTNIS